MQRTLPRSRLARTERWLALLVICLCVDVVLSACDDTFSPIAPSEVQFSVFGYLDASADTQWVRVMPIRELRLTSPDPLGATVTLERLGTGQIITLRDSVFSFTDQLNPDVGTETAYVHNFWTTEAIYPDATYRFSARFGDGEAAEAEVKIPRHYEAQVWIAQARYGTDYVRLSGLRHLPFLSLKSRFFNRCGSGIDTVWTNPPSGDESVHMVPIRRAEVTREGCGTARVEKREIWAAGSDSEWPSGQDYSTWGLGVTERVSNITNAVGFLGGVLTMLIPYEDCRFQGGGGPVPEYCQLDYGPESAAISGTILEIRCGDGPIDSTYVEMSELDGEPASNRKVRTIFANRSGKFEIAGLKPGIRYFLKVRAPPELDPFWGEVDIHTLQTDTLMFAPGERMDYDVRLERLTVCGSGP